MENPRRAIGLKITVIIAVSMLVFLGVSVGLNYFSLFDASRNDTMESRKRMANLMAGAISETIDTQAELLKVNASSGILVEAAEESNAKYKSMDAEAARRYNLDIDSKWIQSPGDHPLIQEYLGNPASLFLKSNTKQRAGFFNILAADKYGALIGASYKSRSFYCGGEDWFKEISLGSKNKILLGDAIFDEQNGKWSYPLAAAIENENGEAVGAYRAFVDISMFFKPMESFGEGKNGKAALIDSRGYLMFYPGVKPFSNK